MSCFSRFRAKEGKLKVREFIFFNFLDDQNYEVLKSMYEKK